MAIYHLNMRSIGRSSHAAGSAGAHVRYITRPEAEPIVMAQHMPNDRWQARAWFDAQEKADRKNARVADKLNIALPRELNSEQRQAVVNDFCGKLTQGRTPFYAVIHQEHGNDQDNPHAHIVLRDRDFETGKRVMCLSDSPRDRTKKGFQHPKAMDQVRELWAEVCNQHLERAGFDARIDHRTLKAQKIDREPQIHVGAWSNRTAANDDARPQSQNRLTEAWGKERLVIYNAIDDGKTRAEHNAEIIQLEEFRQAKAAEQAQRQAEEMDRRAIALADAEDRRVRRQIEQEAEALYRARHAQDSQRTATPRRETDPPSLGERFEKQADPKRQALEAEIRREREVRAEAQAKQAKDAAKQEARIRQRIAKAKAEAQRLHRERVVQAVENAKVIREEFAKGKTLEERTATRAEPKVAKSRRAFEAEARRAEPPPLAADFKAERGGDRLQEQVKRETDQDRKLARLKRRQEIIDEKRRMTEKGRSRSDPGRTRPRGDPKK